MGSRDVPTIAPVLPLTGAVLLPGETRLLAGLDGLGAADARRARAGRLQVVVVPSGPSPISGDDRDESSTRVEMFGALATVRKLRRLPTGELGAEVTGERRVRLLALTKGPTGSLRARITELDDVEERGVRVEAAFRTLKTIARRLADSNPLANTAVKKRLTAVAAALDLIRLVSPLVNLEHDERLTLASEVSILKRLRLLVKVAEREERLGRVSEEIRDKAADGMKDDERRAFLREQVRVMRRELGDDADGGSEVEELANALDVMPLPEAVRDTVERELSRMAMMMPGSPEYMVSHTYVSLIRDLPWTDVELAKPSLAAARRALGKDHFGLARVKERILEYLAVMLHKGDARGDVLLLVGPPGVGKSTLARQIAAALKRPFVTVSLGGVRDEAEIRGHRRTYVGSMPGKILTAVKLSKSNAPIVLLDELDKLGLDHGRSSVASALLEVLDHSQNHAFVDHYLGVPFDLSKIVFIATANSTVGLPAPLLDRMEIVELPSYTESEKREIAMRHLIPKARNDLGMDGFDLDADAITAIIRGYTREAGVRQLERVIRTFARKLLVGGAKARDKKCGESRVSPILGPVKYQDEPNDAKLVPGVALGLAYTAHGGDILYIESAISPSADGRSRLTQTGSLGKVMKESTQAAWAYLTALVHARSELLGIAPEVMSASHVHLHLPSGAVPKDGPSAGLAVVVALASLLTGRPLEAKLAMTGEISLRGQVLAIGGLKEKLLAAHRYGKRRVLIPEANRADLVDVPREVLRELDVIPVPTLEDALRHAGLTAPAGLKRAGAARIRADRPLKSDKPAARVYDLR